MVRGLNSITGEHTPNDRTQIAIWAAGSLRGCALFSLRRDTRLLLPIVEFERYGKLTTNTLAIYDGNAILSTDVVHCALAVA
jgi:hypothetical protein